MTLLRTESGWYVKTYLKRIHRLNHLSCCQRKWCNRWAVKMRRSRLHPSRERHSSLTQLPFQVYWIHSFWKLTNKNVGFLLFMWSCKIQACAGLVCDSACMWSGQTNAGHFRDSWFIGTYVTRDDELSGLWVIFFHIWYDSEILKISTSWFQLSLFNETITKIY